jgi:hypothetical protein
MRASLANSRELHKCRTIEVRLPAIDPLVKGSVENDQAASYYLYISWAARFH